MTFARRLAAVLLTVAVVVALMLAWAHSSEASWLGAPRPAGVKFVHPGLLPRVRPGRIHQRGAPGLSLSNLNDLIRTGVIEAALAAVVVSFSALRRRARRARRLRPAP